jgi:ribosomal protein RSM22 (predicted rRNA methylase)
MRLPEVLQSRILELSRAISPGELQKAAQRLSEVYRKDSVPPPLRTEAERLAYLLVRMPATYAAIHHALAAVSECLPGWAPKSMLDLGAGPGTGLWAAIEIHHQLGNADAVEREAAFVQLAMKLAPAFSQPVGWKTSDLQSWKPDRKYDLVLASYAIGELSADVRKRLVSAAWEACTGALVFVEPGTRRGFGVIAEVREQLISMGASIAAPCPHDRECPMKAAGDWCHFSTRVERTAEHRRLKQAELGHEDEKFSYVAASRVQPDRATARIVRHPQRLRGHVKLQLCAEDGLRQETVTRSQKEKYRAVKRVDWGSRWD